MKTIAINQVLSIRLQKELGFYYPDTKYNYLINVFDVHKNFTYKSEPVGKSYAGEVTFYKDDAQTEPILLPKIIIGVAPRFYSLYYIKVEDYETLKLALKGDNNVKNIHK